jgi:alanine racemase
MAAEREMTAQRPTWCEIDLSAISDNLAALRQMVGPAVNIFVCLKGDASGCGDIVVGRLAEAAGIAGIAFGNLDRAIAARKAGIRLPILLYPTCLPEDAPALEAYDLMPTLSTLEDVAEWSSYAKSLKVFLKLDGGGFRAGALPRQAATVARAIAASETLHLAGAYGHPMASYGPVDPVYTNAQIASCIDALRRIEAAGVVVPIRMVSSSAVILSHPEADLNAIDPGRLVLGQSFPAVEGRQRTWRHALVGLRSRLVMVKSLDDIGDVMPAPFIRRRPGMRIGLVPFDWTDGFPRSMPETATVLVRGRRASLLGPPHSELMRVDLTDVPEAQLGDDVVLLGRSGDDEISLAELSSQWRLEIADLYCAIGKSVRRSYVA